MERIHLDLSTGDLLTGNTPAHAPQPESPVCEPTLDDMLADPMVRLLMQRDRVDEDQIRRLRLVRPSQPVRKPVNCGGPALAA
jgi:hypothetical protein